MQRLAAWVARVLVMGVLVFPVCPMIAQAHGSVLIEHASMHGMMTSTDHQSHVEARVGMESCCATTSVVTPAVAEKNGFSFPILICTNWTTADTAAITTPSSPCIERNIGPPDQKFETRSTSKRE